MKEKDREVFCIGDWFWLKFWRKRIRQLTRKRKERKRKEKENKRKLTKNVDKKEISERGYGMR